MLLTEIFCIAFVVVAIMLCIFLAFACYALYRLAEYLLEKELLCSHIRDVFRDLKYDFRDVLSKRMCSLISTLSFGKKPEDN